MVVKRMKFSGDRQWMLLSDEIPEKYKQLHEPDFTLWYNEKMKELHDKVCQKVQMEQDYEHTNGEFWLSRSAFDFRKKQKPPIRLWKINKEGKYEKYEKELTIGSIVVAESVQLRAYHGERVGTCSELGRNIIVVVGKKQERPVKRRKIAYISDSD